MKKAVSIFLTVILLLSLTACGDSLEAAEVIEVNTAQDSPTYVEGEDCQQQWDTWGSIDGKMVSVAESGFYFYDEYGTSKLYFYDFTTGQSVPLCNQPNCDHSGDCSANLQFGTHFLHYYDGNLYTLYNNISGDIVIQRISADGSIRGDVGSVCSFVNGGSVVAVFHRGYVYCVPSADGLVEHSAKVYRLNLGGGEEAELIHTFDPCIGGDVYMRAYGNYLYIQLQSYADSDANGYTADLWRYNIHTGDMELVMEGMRRMFAVDDRYLYYDSDTQVIARDLESGEETVLLDVGFPVYITYDGKYLYCDNKCGRSLAYYATDAYPEGERTITIIDTETLQIAGIVEWGPDSNYLVGAANGMLLGAKHTSGGSQFYRCSLSLVLAGEEAVWAPLE